MCTGVLIDRGTYGQCIKVGGPLWFTGNSLSEKLHNSLVSALLPDSVFRALIEQHFASLQPSFCSLNNVNVYALIEDILLHRIV